MRFGRYLAAMTMLVSATAAQAEAVRMTGRFVAEARDVAMQRSVAVGRFDGRDGAAFALALERALASGDERTPPQFDIVSADHGRADAVVSGAVSTDVDFNDWTRTERKCVEKDAAKKCVRKEEFRTRCTRRTIAVDIDVRVMGDRLLYAANRPKQDDTSWCEGEEPFATVETTIRGLIDRAATETARSFAPQVVNYSVRFRETTRGLAKPLHKPFKASVRQSQLDLKGACTAWAAIDAQAPGHASTLFDLGLCAEAVGDYPRAADFYRRAAPLMSRGNEAEAGLTRVARLVAARDDDAVRGSR